MKLSLSWIRDYVELPADLELKKLAYDLTMDTVEVEDVENLADRFANMVVGVIEEVQPHPNADKLRVCRVNLGDQVQEIVCGGINLANGQKVAVACPGAMVRWHGEGEPVVIKNSKLRGVASFGMICASDEIGLGDLLPASQEAEIADLSAFDASAGTPLAVALGLDDQILEIDNQSMTNRPDLWGHYGIAREIAALYGLPLKKFEPFDCSVTANAAAAQMPAGGAAWGVGCGALNGSGANGVAGVAAAGEDICKEPFHIEIEDPDRCPRYIGVELEGVFVKPSPFWMQSRIWRVGMRPINALVDVTNYVMLATGNPTHAFDADNISGHIVVRLANAGEKLLLLNDKDLTLCADDLVITDAEGPVALAGVMGGAKDSILPKTTRVILEVANFESTGIRRTALRYDNRTEASARYEKAVDPERCDQAVAMALELFRGLYPEMKVTGVCDRYPKKLSRAEIDVDLDWLARRLGMDLPFEVIKAKLESLGFDVAVNAFDANARKMHVTAPTWRSTGDISIKDDVMEEVARMYGYDNFQPTPITTTFDHAINQKAQDLLRRIKEYLAFRCGLQEVYTYPWMNDTFVSAILPDTEGVLKLSTPPAPNLSYIRSTLLPNLCEAVVKNERYFEEFKFFEEAQVFFDRNYTAPYDPVELLPEQKRHIGGAFASSRASVEELFREAKGTLEYMPRYTHMEGFTFERREQPSWADPAVWLDICLGGESIGKLGLLSKRASMACGIKSVKVMLFELDVTKLLPFASRTNRFAHLPEYPVSEYDISMLFDADVRWEAIAEAVLGGKKAALLRGASFVDEYRGKQVPEGKKSVTIRLVIGSDEKTLSSEEIEKCAAQVMKKLGKSLGAELRQK